MSKNDSRSLWYSLGARRAFGCAVLALLLQGAWTETAHAQSTLTSFFDGSQHVFYVSRNTGHVHHVYCPGFCLNWINQDLTPQIVSTAPVVYFPITGFNDAAGMHVLYKDGNGNLNRLDCKSNCGQVSSWVNRTVAIQVTSRFNAYSETINAGAFDYVYYGIRAADSHLTVLVSTMGFKVEEVDLTFATGAPSVGMGGQ